jgi:hypothetical protein
MHGSEQRDVRIAVETDRYRIVGNVVLPREGYRSRLTDFLNGGEREFIAMTEVEVDSLDRPGEPVRTDFIALSRHHIVIARELTRG